MNGLRNEEAEWHEAAEQFLKENPRRRHFRRNIENLESRQD